jgi:hypothetical protein
LSPFFTADRAEDARPAGVAGLPNEHGGVLVETDVAAIGTSTLFRRTNDDSADDVTLLHTSARQRVLDGPDDDVADAGVPTARATEHADAKNLLRTRVVGDAQPRLLLDH